MRLFKIVLNGLRWLVRVVALGYLVLWLWHFDTVSLIPDAGWTAGLPSCPCEQPPANLTGDGWAVDIGSLERNHPGATICYRSYPAVPTPQGDSGQQCCYDEGGKLITKGKAAGTPDRASNCVGEGADGRMSISLKGVILHYFKDVIPSRKLTTEQYNRLWTPDDCQ